MMGCFSSLQGMIPCPNCAHGAGPHRPGGAQKNVGSSGQKGLCWSSFSSQAAARNRRALFGAASRALTIINSDSSKRLAGGKGVGMQKGTKYALLCGSVPFVTLVLALPFVNRVEPFILGLPFILFWIILWVAMTPLALFAAYRCEKKFNLPEREDEE
jgi:hypothetical protein